MVSLHDIVSAPVQIEAWARACYSPLTDCTSLSDFLVLIKLMCDVGLSQARICMGSQQSAKANKSVVVQFFSLRGLGECSILGS